MHFKSLILLIPIFIFLSVGCATHKTRPHIDSSQIHRHKIDFKEIQALTFHQTKENIISNGLQLTSIKAKAKISIMGPDINGTFKCKGVLRFQKPNKLRVIGSKLATTVFDMLSDGEDFWFYLPKEKVVYTGKCDSVRKPNKKTNVYIFPDDIAVFLNYDRLFEGRPAFMEAWPEYVYIHVLEKAEKGLTPYGRLKIDRIDNKLTELILFYTDSTIKAQAYFKDYTTIDGQTIPKSIQINWPQTQTSLVLDLSKITINAPLNPKIFQFKKPKKAEIIKIN